MTPPDDYWLTDPDDPEAPIRLDEYRGLKPGDRVRYTGPMPLPGPLTLTDLYEFPPLKMIQAILNEGEYEVNADNLRRAQ